VGGAATEADEDARRSGAHEVQGGLVRRAAAHDHGHVELVDELLEVQRLAVAGHVLRRDRRAPDDEQVDARVDDRLGELAGALGRQRTGHRDACLAHLLQPRGDQVGLDRLGIDLLQAAGGVLSTQPRDVGEQRLGSS
jgi:hypothetical protein